MKTQAWGWLVAGVVAAGLNGLYHDGGAEWLHQVANRVEHSSAAVIALASGRADAFLTEARLLTRDEAAPLQLASREAKPCRFATAWARVQAAAAQSDADWARFETRSAREQANWARLEANRVRMHALISSRSARLRAAAISDSDFDFDYDDDFSTIATPACPQIRVRVPQPPGVHVQVPKIHVETMNLGPV